MSTYNIRMIKTRRSYTPTEIAYLFAVDTKTVHRWLDEGLSPIACNRKPLLIMGAELKRFLLKRKQDRKVSLEPDEYFCMGCRKATKAKNGTEQIISTGKKIGRVNKEQMKKIAKCDACNRNIQRLLHVSPKTTN